MPTVAELELERRTKSMARCEYNKHTIAHFERPHEATLMGHSSYPTMTIEERERMTGRATLSTHAHYSPDSKLGSHAIQENKMSNCNQHESVYISRLINIAICRYIERDQPVPVDLEAKLSELGVIVPLM